MGPKYFVVGSYLRRGSVSLDLVGPQIIFHIVENIQPSLVQNFSSWIKKVYTHIATDLTKFFLIHFLVYNFVYSDNLKRKWPRLSLNTSQTGC